jgi:C_GCAxxG_C_C family probable redox protein
MDKFEQAMHLHNSGFNCCQSVFAAFSDEINLDQKTALRIATSFGGGIRVGSVCGAVTGALMVLGMQKGHDSFNDLEEKQRANEITIDFIERYRRSVGHIECKEILGFNPSIPCENQEKERDEIKAVRCPVAIETAVKLLIEII